MTTEAAIKYLQLALWLLDAELEGDDLVIAQEAYSMAIDALEKQVGLGKYAEHDTSYEE